MTAVDLTPEVPSSQVNGHGMQILRVIDSLQLTANHSVATPVNWKHGQDVVVVPGLTDDQANAKVW